jgi:hypothetical protein
LAQFYSASWLLPDIFLSGRCWARHRSDFKRLFVADEPPPFVFGAFLSPPFLKTLYKERFLLVYDALEILKILV